MCFTPPCIVDLTSGLLYKVGCFFRPFARHVSEKRFLAKAGYCV